MHETDGGTREIAGSLAGGDGGGRETPDHARVGQRASRSPGGTVVDHRLRLGGRAGGGHRSDRARVGRHHGAGAQVPGHPAGPAGKSSGVARSRSGKGADQGRTQPFLPDDAAGGGVPRDRRDPCAADGADPAQGAAQIAREDTFFDGTAGRAVLPERHAARDRRRDAAGGGHRWSSAGLVRDGTGGSRVECATGHRAAQGCTGVAEGVDGCGHRRRGRVV